MSNGGRVIDELRVVAVNAGASVERRVVRYCGPVPSDTHGNAFEHVYLIVEQIPRGRVATYGQVSRMLDGRFSPLFVGWALHAVPEAREPVPWHRVVNSKGGISTRRVMGFAPDLQRALLEDEGVQFGDDDCIDLQRFQWKPA